MPPLLFGLGRGPLGTGAALLGIHWTAGSPVLLSQEMQAAAIAR
jgi:hypothetical protein